MLSALIPSIHSYPAIHLVAKPVDQRYVQPSPLVDRSHITMCSDYIFALRLREWGVGILTKLKSNVPVAPSDQVVTGSNLTILVILVWIF
jgi:hypothetical protein